MILFEDEASFAQWGSLSYTWARRGRQSEGPTSGKRKGHKVYGAIEYVTGRLFYQGIEGRFNSESYQAFLPMIMRQSRNHSARLQPASRRRLTVANKSANHRQCRSRRP